MTSTQNLESKVQSVPKIFQGGMGLGVSNWKMANAVSSHESNKAVGVVSGSGIDTVFVRRLQEGDFGGHMRRAMGQFPFPEISKRVLDDYFIEGGKQPSKPFKSPGMFGVHTNSKLLQLNTLASFVEVFLAKEGHNNPVGINLLEKLQLPLLSNFYGAQLAGVDYVMMGAGMPFQVPKALDLLSQHKETTYKIDVTGESQDSNIVSRFNPKELFGELEGTLKRPQFYAIVASNLAANVIMKKVLASSSTLEGWIVEGIHIDDQPEKGPLAGGHNAPPRRKNVYNDRGELMYGPKDIVHIEKLNELGLPVILAGAYGAPGQLEKAEKAGAKGIQVASLFSLSDESGYDPLLKQRILNNIKEGDLDVYTDPVSSPTGYPFKALQLEGTHSQESIYLARPRDCSMGHLRENYLKPKKNPTDKDEVGYRCASEPIEDYVRKGGTLEKTKGKKCLCNHLMANIGLAQIQKNGYKEGPLITAGDMINTARDLLKDGKTSYSARDVVDYLLK